MQFFAKKQFVVVLCVSVLGLVSTQNSEQHFIDMNNKPKSRKARWFRRAFIAGLIASVLFAGLWQNYLFRHKALRGMSKIESVLYPLLPESTIKGAGIEFSHRSNTIDRMASGGPNLEIDICFSSDLVPFCSHGDDIVGTQIDKLDLQTMSAAEAMKAGRIDGKQLLKLEHLADYLPATTKRILFDIKSNHDRAEEKADVLATLIESFPQDITVTCLSGPVIWHLMDEVDIGCGVEAIGPFASWFSGTGRFHGNFLEISDPEDRIAGGLGLKCLYYTRFQEYSPLQPEWIIVDDGTE